MARTRWLAAATVAAAALALLLAPAQAHDAPDPIWLNVTARQAGSPCAGEATNCWFTVGGDGVEPDGTERNPSFTLDRGATVHVTFENPEGNSPHTLEIGGMGTKVSSGNVDPGNEESWTFQVPWETDGEAVYWCDYHPESMNGTVSYAGTNAAPSLAVDAPGEGAAVEGEVTLEGDASDPDDDPVTVEVRTPDTSPWREAGPGWAFTWDSTAVGDGNHSLAIRALDPHGFAAHANRTLQVVNDRNRPPEVAVDRPGPGAEVRGLVTIEGMASDPDGTLDRVEVRTPSDDGVWEQVAGTSSWSHEWNASQVDPGSYNVTVRALDAEGAETTTRLPLEVVAASANRAPRLAVGTPARGEAVDGTVPVAGEVSDPDDDPLAVEVRTPGNRTWSPAQDPDDDGGWTYTWNASGLEPGEHTLAVRARDGNDTTRRNVPVVVRQERNRPPTVSFVAPDRDEEIHGPVTVVLEASDVDEGDRVETVRVRFAEQDTFREAEPRAGDRWRVRLPTGDLPRGEARITAVASDGEAAGRAVQRVRLPEGPSSEAPVVNVTDGPPDEARGLVTIRGAVRDNRVRSPPLQVELRVAGDLADLVEQNAPGSFSLSWNPRRTASGVHDVVVQAYDGASASEPVTFAVRVPGEDAEAAGGAGAVPTPGPGGLGAAMALMVGAAAGRRCRRS
jgi:hypothetical protein